MVWGSIQTIPSSSPTYDANADREILDQQRYTVPDTPSTTSEDAPPPRPYQRHSGDTDSEDDYEINTRSHQLPRRKPGGYDSRIEQILYENPELPILITDAGKSIETGGRYIVYTIRTGV